VPSAISSAAVHDDFTREQEFLDQMQQMDESRSAGRSRARATIRVSDRDSDRVRGR